MNKKEYLKNKKYRSNLIKQEQHRSLCFDCYKPKKNCFCKSVISFSTNSKIVLLMHPKEAKKQKVGTGRITHKILTNSKIIIDENFDKNILVQKLINDKDKYCVILYPGIDSLNLSKATLNNSLVKKSKSKEIIIFVVDGTWPCAKSMMRDSKSLHNLPRVSFDNNKVSKFIIKQQPDSYCLSTIESVYFLLESLENIKVENTENKKENLLLMLEKIVRFQISCSLNPELKTYKRGSYNLENKENYQKGKNTRKICFDKKNYKV